MQFGFDSTKFNVTLEIPTGCSINSNSQVATGAKLIFEVQSGITGSVSLGTGVNNTATIINNIENQNGIFYIDPICTTVNNNTSGLNSALNGIELISCYFNCESITYTQ